MPQWEMLANNVVSSLSLSLFFLLLLLSLSTARPISASRVHQENVSYNKNDIPRRFPFKLCVFRKPPCSDLILEIQLSAGISSIKGDRENKSLPSKDCVCLWQRL